MKVKVKTNQQVHIYIMCALQYTQANLLKGHIFIRCWMESGTLSVDGMNKKSMLNMHLRTC